MTDYKTLIKTYKGFLFCVTKTELAELNLGTDRLSKKFHFRHPSKQVINNENLFWEAAIYSFPLDPPYEKPGNYVSDALADSLFGGFLGLLKQSKTKSLKEFKSTTKWLI